VFLRLDHWHLLQGGGSEVSKQRYRFDASAWQDSVGVAEEVG
jgi:hypothetical protein